MWCTVYTSLSPMYTLIACTVKPYFFPDVWTTMGGCALLLKRLRDRSALLGEESLDEGLEERERGDRGLGRLKSVSSRERGRQTQTQTETQTDTDT